MQNANCRDPSWWFFAGGDPELPAKLDANMTESPEKTFRWMMREHRMRPDMMLRFRELLEDRLRGGGCAEGERKRTEEMLRVVGSKLRSRSR